MTNDINNLSHTTWNGKYHIVFAPKYRRQVFYKDKKVETGKVLRQLCEWKKRKRLWGLDTRIKRPANGIISTRKCWKKTKKKSNVRA